MADAAVEFVLDNLTQLLLHHTALIQDVKTHVESLDNDLRLLRAFLKNFRRKSKDSNNSIRSSDLVKEIRSTVYEIEDAIDAYITETIAYRKSNPSIIRQVLHAPPQLIAAADRVKAIGEKVKGISASLFNMEPDKVSFTTTETDLTGRVGGIFARENDRVVGLESDVRTVISYLNEESRELDVISIIGLAGLGKTTLASKIYGHPEIQNAFKPGIRIWISLHQVFNRRDVFLQILREITIITNDLESRTDPEIAQMIREGLLQKSSFLIVMDGVWSPEAWRDLKDAFPKMHKMGKILITSRNEEVALEANRNRDPYKLRFLTFNESWLLLLLEVFGENYCPKELEIYGKTIVHKCSGLPLAIVVIGGILLKKSMCKDIMVRKNAWRKVSESVPHYLQEDQNVDNIIAMSYDKLPYYMRPCFLYLGMFPEGFEIPVWTLIRLWIAEGFIQPESGATLEQTAHDYLEELVNRNLVMIGKKRADGQFKTCSIHSILRGFCRNQAGADEQENFFQEFTKSSNGDISPPFAYLETCRRVCIHSRAVLSGIISSQASGSRVRTFLFFSNEESFPLTPENASSVPAAFRMLKVLDAKPVIFTRFPGDLVHLKYVVLSINFTVIPEAIAELWNLQTLIVYTSSRILEIKGNIWRMLQLTHIQTNVPAILPNPVKGGAGRGTLQTLGKISPQSCKEDVFNRARNLETLGIRGSLVSLMNANGLNKLERLEKLKLVHDSDQDSHLFSGQKLQRLPYAHKFPPRLRWLTLRATQLNWEHMSTLALLDSLEVLKLKEKAFMGKHWETVAGGFLCLEVLHIEDTDLVTWEAEADNFPRLKCLLLKNCKLLEEIPHSLRDVESLERLELNKVNQYAVDSAEKIENAKKRQASSDAPASNRSKFQLRVVD